MKLKGSMEKTTYSQIKKLGSPSLEDGYYEKETYTFLDEWDRERERDFLEGVKENGIVTVC